MRGARESAARGELEHIHGLRAALAVCRRRPEDVIEVGFSRDVASQLGDLRASLRRHGAKLGLRGERELRESTGTTQHEGLCVVARARRWSSPSEIGTLLLGSRGTAVALDRIRNPHNIGAILRSAAFFGMSAAVLGAPAPSSGLDPLALRVAEGGAEHLALCRTTDLAQTLLGWRRLGIAVIGADARASRSVFDFVVRRPAAIVLGHEREGLGNRVRRQCDELLAIPGDGALDSLNVGVAAGVLMALTARS